MSGHRMDEVITFKADTALAEAMRTIPNRSQFIRSAILAALENVCPLCGGAGVVSEAQLKALAGRYATERNGRPTIPPAGVTK